MEQGRAGRNRALRRLIVIEILVLLVALAWRWRASAPRPLPVMQGGTAEVDRTDWHFSTPDERKRAAASIRAQLDAFKVGDYKKAAVYQSSNLRRNFPSVAFFRRMIETGYPEFAHYRSVKFGQARSDPLGKHVEILIVLTGEDGVTVHAVYRMVDEDRVYRVDGVSGGQSAPAPPGISA